MHLEVDADDLEVVLVPQLLLDLHLFFLLLVAVVDLGAACQVWRERAIMKATGSFMLMGMRVVVGC
jgi:hypothetical protein